jgi:hypothetical protein
MDRFNIYLYSQEKRVEEFILTLNILIQQLEVSSVRPSNNKINKLINVEFYLTLISDFELRILLIV